MVGIWTVKDPFRLNHLPEVLSGEGTVLLYRGLRPRPEQIDRKLEQIELTSTRMQDIIKNFLDINAIESGRINLAKKEIDILEVLDKVITDNNVLTERKGIKINTICEFDKLIILADYMGLNEVLENLFSNSIYKIRLE